MASGAADNGCLYYFYKGCAPVELVILDLGYYFYIDLRPVELVLLI
jgi:hypothetical protein